jgi:Tol biopolymer transport system component
MVLLQRRGEVDEVGNRLPPWFLAVFNIETKNSIDLEKHTLGHCWSHDGKRVFYGRPAVDGATEIVSVRADGTERKSHFQLPGAAYVDDISPDGTTLLLTVESNAVVAIPPVREREKDIFKAALDGKELANLTQDPSLDKRARFSPDATKILFVSTRSGTSQLYSMSSDGTAVMQLTSFPEEAGRLTGAIYGCAWSPDGGRVTYSWTWFPPYDRQPSVTYVASADGTDASVVLSDAQEPDWR